ncbi:MAG: hypothetical protein HS126_38880 [Anaerolineales bacterium]|nr:hypothetical protein [Anaerolineales bacterium]
MTQIHYFQRYSQKENVVTNNTLLLFSRLYSYSPFRLQAFLNEILQDVSIDVGVSFKQQIKAQKDSIPDGLLIQQSFKVVVETKLYSNYDPDQLRRHLQAFSSEETQVLLLLNPSEPSPEFKTEVKAFVRDFNKSKNTNIVFVCTTFAQVIESYKGVLAEHDYEMIELLEDYRNFCTETGLLPRVKYTMRAVGCGLTLDENFEFNLYYDAVNKSYREHKYIGIYANKCIRGIGEIENVIVADLVNSTLQILESVFPVTDDHRRRIVKVIAKAKDNNGWDISKGMRFFLVKHVYETEYRKQSRGSMRGTQYFDLGELLGISDLPDTVQIAEMLKTKDW